MRFRDEEGQAVLVVVLLSSIFLLGAVGLGVDGGHMYAQRQMAQTAADSAALAAITTIYNRTNTGTTSFPTNAAFNCGTTDARTPCKYAANNGFGGSADDTVTIDFPGSGGAPGVSLSPDYPVNVARATIYRNVHTTLLSLLGTSVSSIKATATAAIVYVVAPVPILVTHPTLDSSFSISGTPVVKICGGPSRSIQVNSNATTANAGNGNASVNLSHAGPADTNGDCTTGTGADFGSRGGPSSFNFLTLGTTGHYVQPDLLMQDPLENVPYPPLPVNVPPMGTHAALADGVSGCPLPNPGKPCQLYYPGVYTGDATNPAIDGKGSTAVFMPGIYYLQSVYASQPSKGFAIDCASNCDMKMATGAVADTMTGTGWTNNVMFYNIGLPADPTNAGRFSIAANGGANLVGACMGSPCVGTSTYKGILFFQNRNTVAQGHTLGGGGAMTLQGTIYLTNTIDIMSTTSSQYQSLTLQGGSGSGTLIQGEIIVGSLGLGGNGSITMNLNANKILLVSQIALVN
jgi:Flp pilus assembly protein TadG